MPENRHPGAGRAARLQPLIPPLVMDLLRRLAGRRYGFHGNYRRWQDAVADSTGYSDEVILNRVKDALLRVKAGEGAYERDGVVFTRPAVHWPLMACLMRIAARRGNRLHVVDFGGSLGSLYFQHAGFLNSLRTLKWSVVEQPHFVQCGRQLFEDHHLLFFSDIDGCLSRGEVDVVLLSSVLPYLEKPYDLLSECRRRRLGNVLIDRTPFLENQDRDRLTVQQVPPWIYPACYPAWFFGEKKFLSFLEGRFRVAAAFPGADRANIASVYKGWLLEPV